MKWSIPDSIWRILLLSCALAALGTGCNEDTLVNDGLAYADARVFDGQISIDGQLDSTRPEETMIPDAMVSSDALVLMDAEFEVDAMQVSLDQDVDQSFMPDTVDAELDQGIAPEECEPWGNGCEALARWSNGNATRYPIVLVHGFFGWDEVLWLEYFYDIPDTLHDAGYSVFVAQMDPINSSEVRSRQLARFVDDVLRCTCAEKLNFIGHSQGGLDARYLIGPLGYAENVASITTISSPHRGYELAEDGAQGNEIGIRFLEAITGLMSWFIRGNPEQPNDLRETLNAMSITTRSAYNEAWPDPPEVPIYSFAGFTNPLGDGGALCEQGERAAPRRGDFIEPALIIPHNLLGGRRTPNDGIVTVEACIWGRFLGCIPADHFDQIGQISGLSDFDFREFYLEQALFLVNEGH